MSFPNAQNCKGVFCQAESVAKIPTPFPSAGKTSAVIHDKLNWLFCKIIIQVLLNGFLSAIRSE